MIKNAKRFKTAVFLLLLLWGLSTQYSIGYGMYIGKSFVGTVHNFEEARAIMDILSAEINTKAFSPAFYLRLLPREKFSDPSEILENVKTAGGIETEIVTNTISIPYDTHTVEDASLYKGENAIRTEGVPGSRTVITQVTKQNGEVLGEKVLSDVINEEPITKILTIGTKPKPAGSGTGTFSFPLSEISVSSPFGARWGRKHDGLDFAAETGTNIVAADSGTVTYSGACEGYGNLLILDHKNGFTTYYAHCSTLYAAVGATPEKGEVIAAVGSTGNSTGPHLHFEIRKNEEPQDPMLYLPGNPL